MTSIKPYNSSQNKKKQIIQMFNNIAGSYDLLNHYLSFGMDNIWRKNAIKKLTNNPKNILDIATGTADFAITAAKHTNAKIIGIDISKEMLEIGKEKIKKQRLTEKISLKLADCEELPFNSNSFDAITAGFGVRNFENMKKGLKEIYRVTKSDGIILVLEPSSPKYFPFKQLYNLYFQYILPKIGALISKDKKAYSYLPNSVKAFPTKKHFIYELEEIGFRECKHISLTFGIVSLYIAIK